MGSVAEDEIACRSLGLSPRRIKLTALPSAPRLPVLPERCLLRARVCQPGILHLCRIGVCAGDSGLGGMGSQFAVILAAILLVVSES